MRSPNSTVSHRFTWSAKVGMLTLLGFLVGCNTNPTAGGTSEETNSLAGIVLDSLGRPLVGLPVALRPQEFRTQQTLMRAALSAELVVSFEAERWDTTDTQGGWRFRGMTPGSYVLSTRHWDGRILYRPVEVRFGQHELAPDTLHTPGEYRGRVALRWDIAAGVQVHIPGTDFFTHTDSSGNFLLSPVPRTDFPLSILSPDPSRYSSAFYHMQEGGAVHGPFADVAARGSAVPVDSQVLVVPVNPEYGIMAWWNFDYLRLGGQLPEFYDSRGRSAIGSVYGGSAVPGISSNGLHLQGPSQFAVVPQSGALLSQTAEFTIEAWVRVTRLPDSSGFMGNIVGQMGFGGPGSTDLFSLAVVQNVCGHVGAAFAFFLSDGSGQLGCESMIADSLPLVQEQWVHLAATWDGREAALFVDGRRAASAAKAFENLLESQEALYFGKEDLTFDLDEVRIVNLALGSEDLFFRRSLLD